MFDRSANLYDALYDAIGKNYETEARAVLSGVQAVRPDAATLLDVACGTGRHLEFFARSLECVGVDIDGGLLAVARGRCPDVRFIEADMVDFDLGERFDVVACLFSSIGYARTPERLGHAVGRMAAHLRDGGVLVVEPWFGPDQWTEGFVQVVNVEQTGLSAVRMMQSGREGDVSILDGHYLVAGPSGIEHFVERHELGLFTMDAYAAAFEAAGLLTSIDAEGLTGRGLITGVKR